MMAAMGEMTCPTRCSGGTLWLYQRFTTPSSRFWDTQSMQASRRNSNCVPTGEAHASCESGDGARRESEARQSSTTSSEGRPSDNSRTVSSRTRVRMAEREMASASTDSTQSQLGWLKKCQTKAWRRGHDAWGVVPVAG